MKKMRIANTEYRIGNSEGANRRWARSRERLTFHPSLTTHQQGFTLLEVLIATGILVFGILAIVKIFPAGLGVIKSNESVNIATRLAEDMQGRYQRLKDQLPDAVIAVDSSGNFVTNIDPDSTPDNGSTNSIDSVKRVVGESHTVLSNGNVLVSFPPLATPDLTNADPELRNPRVYLSYPLTQVSGSPSGNDQFSVLNATLTFSANVMARNNYARVSYAFIDKNNPGKTYYVKNERLQIPTSGTPNVAGANPQGTGPVTNANFQLVDGSMSVVEEKAADPTKISVDATHEVISINDPAMPAGSPVKVDYTVSDWRSITESATTTPSAVVKLLFNDLVPVSGGTYVYVINPADGSSVAVDATRFPPNGVDNRAGSVYFNATLTNTPVRITYMTGSQWLAQLLKAPTTFTDVRTYDASSNETTETYREFADQYWQTPDTSQPNYQQILGFAEINAGNTVVVDYVDTSGNSHYGELHAIGTSADAAPVYASFPYQITLYYPYRDLLSVRGVSNTARVAWISDKGMYRKVEIATYLAKS